MMPVGQLYECPGLCKVPGSPRDSSLPSSCCEDSLLARAGVCCHLKIMEKSKYFHLPTNWQLVRVFQVPFLLPLFRKTVFHPGSQAVVLIMSSLETGYSEMVNSMLAFFIFFVVIFWGEGAYY